MANWIEPAKSSRSKCVTCDQVIEKGSARLSEETRDIGVPTLIQRYYHPRCALATVPDVLRRALTDVRDVVIEDRAMLETRLAERLAFETAQRRERDEARHAAERQASAVPVVSDPIAFELTAQLLDDPDDRGALAVLADQLQQTGDACGELIVIQLALAQAGARVELLEDRLDDEDEDDDEPLDARDTAIVKQLRRRKLLLARLTPALDLSDRCSWGIGFIRRLQLVGKTASRMTELAPIWRKPSLRLLSELQITFSSEHDASWIARLVDLVPRSLRRLELTRVCGGELAELVAVLPRLTSLSVSGRHTRLRDGALEPTFTGLAHPTLARLELGMLGATGQADLGVILAQLSPARLPALSQLALGLARPDDARAICAQLVAAGWLDRLTHLAIHNGTGDAVLELALRGKRKLAQLDLTGTAVRAALLPDLARFADDLVAPHIIEPVVPRPRRRARAPRATTAVKSTKPR